MQRQCVKYLHERAQRFWSGDAADAFIGLMNRWDAEATKLNNVLVTLEDALTDTDRDVVSYVDDLRDNIEDALKKADDSLDWITGNAPGIIRAGAEVYFSTVLHLPPGFSNQLADPIISRIENAARDARNGVADIRAVTEHVGSPDRLRAATKTLDGIGRSADTLSGDVILSNLDSTYTNNWDDGDASQRYAHAFDGRRDEIERIPSYVKNVSSGLGDLADEIETYYEHLLAAVIGLVGALVSLAAAIALLETVVGAILGLVAAIIGVVTAGVNICELVLETSQSMSSISDEINIKSIKWQAALK